MIDELLQELRSALAAFAPQAPIRRQIGCRLSVQFCTLFAAENQIMMIECCKKMWL